MRVSAVHAVERLRRDAREIFRAGVAAADPARAVTTALTGETAGLDRGRSWIVAFGKAALLMASAAADEIEQEGGEVAGGIVVTNEENLAALGATTRPPELRALDVRRGGHPLPDADSERSARAVERLLRDEVGEGERVIVLISGGGSALLAAPVDGVSLEAKIETTRLLLEGGADIHQLNAVRKHLSRLKGGRLAALARPASLLALVLSDVVGDDLTTVASGPTVGDPTSHADALEALDAVVGLERVPTAVREHLELGVQGRVEETPGPGDPQLAAARTRLIGGNGLAVEAMALHAASLGYAVTRLDSIAGEAREVARALAARARPAELPHAELAGGETTVTVRGGGRGGRSQELALAFALAAWPRHSESRHSESRAERVLLAGGTDGRDGPTDAAGGVVDRGSVERIRAAGRDPEALLEDNDAYHALLAGGDLLVTGATGTNVADLLVLLTAD